MSPNDMRLDDVRPGMRIIALRESFHWSAGSRFTVIDVDGVLAIEHSDGHYRRRHLLRDLAHHNGLIPFVAIDDDPSRVRQSPIGTILGLAKRKLPALASAIDDNSPHRASAICEQIISLMDAASAVDEARSDEDEHHEP